MSFVGHIKKIVFKFVPFLDRTSGSIYKNVGTYSIARQIFSLKGLILLPIIVKNMDVKSYGYYSLGLMISSFLIWFMMLGLSSGLLRFLPGVNDNKTITQDFNMAFLAVICTSIFVLVLCFLFRETVSLIFFQTKSKTALTMYMVLFSSFEALRTMALVYYRIFDRVNFYVIAEMALNITSIILMVIAVYMYHDVESLFAAQALSSFFILMIVLINYFKIFKFTICPFNRTIVYFKFSIPIMIPTLMKEIMTRFDRILISKYLGIEMVGIYSASCAVPRLIQSMLSSVSFVFEPIFNRLWNQDKKQELINKIEDSANLFLFIAFPMLVGMTLMAKPVMELLANEGVAHYSLLVIPYLGIAYMSYMFYGFGVNIFLFQRKSLVSSYFAVIGAIISVILNIILIPKIGILGSSLSMLIAYLSIAVIALYKSRKYLILKFDGNHIFAIVLSSVLMGVIVRSASYYISNLIVLVLVGIISYLVISRLLADKFVRFRYAG